MRALLTNYRQSPRKVRLVADLIRGKSVVSAKAALSFLPKKSSPAIEKLLDSAVANARSMGIRADTLVVKKITVDKGTVLRRARPFARGRAGSIHKTMSIINLELAPAAPAKAKKARKVKAETKSASAKSSGETK